VKSPLPSPSEAECFEAVSDKRAGGRHCGEDQSLYLGATGEERARSEWEAR
jgi:hypothetical protein